MHGTNDCPLQCLSLIVFNLCYRVEEFRLFKYKLSTEFIVYRGVDYMNIHSLKLDYVLSFVRDFCPTVE